MKKMATIKIFREACKGMEDCGICAYICPKEVFQASGEINAAGYILPVIENEEDCISCGNCMICCPDFAIIVEASEKKSKLNEVIDE